MGSALHITKIHRVILEVSSGRLGRQTRLFGLDDAGNMLWEKHGKEAHRTAGQLKGHGFTVINRRLRL